MDLAVDLGEPGGGQQRRVEGAEPHLADQIGVVAGHAAGVETQGHPSARELLPARGELLQGGVPARAGGDERGHLDRHLLGFGRRREPDRPGEQGEREKDEAGAAHGGAPHSRKRSSARASSQRARRWARRLATRCGPLAAASSASASPRRRVNVARSCSATATDSANGDERRARRRRTGGMRERLPGVVGCAGGGAGAGSPPRRRKAVDHPARNRSGRGPPHSRSTSAGRRFSGSSSARAARSHAAPVQ